MAKKRAFVRYSKQGKIVPGSLILTNGSHPNGPSTWNEVPADLCCEPPTSYSDWKFVAGGIAGDGIAQFNPNGTITIAGPNDSDGNGWAYLKKFFGKAITLTVNYAWSSSDNNNTVDRPIYAIDSTEPTGIPSDINSKVTSLPETGVWTINIPANSWFSLGVYSTDSCCGRGFLNISFS